MPETQEPTADDLIAQIENLGYTVKDRGGILFVSAGGKNVKHLTYDVVDLQHFISRNSHPRKGPLVSKIRVTYTAPDIGSPRNSREKYKWYDRFGSAWVARVESWPDGQRPKLEFGTRIDFNSAEIAARPGEPIMAGRKDYKCEYSHSGWFLVGDDGTLTQITGAEARAAWDAAQSAQ